GTCKYCNNSEECTIYSYCFAVNLINETVWQLISKIQSILLAGKKALLWK
ncbi:hypothetical protein scyTo_0013772, partial [Scyliorhinus torazame]|nr:hypothetical protein [Scyliorhinus torazame]